MINSLRCRKILFWIAGIGFLYFLLNPQRFAPTGKHLCQSFQNIIQNYIRNFTVYVLKDNHILKIYFISIIQEATVL